MDILSKIEISHGFFNPHLPERECLWDYETIMRRTEEQEVETDIYVNVRMDVWEMPTWTTRS